MDFNGHELAHLNSDLNFRSLGNRRRVAKTQPCQRFKETPQCKSSFIINHQEFSWKRTTNNFWFQEHPFYTDMKPLWAFAPLVIFWILMWWRVALWLLDCRVIMIPGKTEDNKDEIFLKTLKRHVWLIQLEVELWNVTASPSYLNPLWSDTATWTTTDATTQRWIPPRSFDQFQGWTFVLLWCCHLAILSSPFFLSLCG